MELSNNMKAFSMMNSSNSKKNLASTGGKMNNKTNKLKLK
jgi:hypothetical protein